jgi:tRNA-specific 2-thiouridylase
MTERIHALSVMSGGLDSILATRVVMDQGVDVTAIHFVTPFFGLYAEGEGDLFSERMADRYGIRGRSVDVTNAYITMLASPQYGYGKNFNPCVDCKILLFSTARRIMEESRARFIVTGEVLGQRPMSQRRDTLRVIERDSSTTGLLLRPLSAKLLKPTIPEIEGWVNREALFGFSGRSRKPQIELASRMGISGYPAPAGGCCLTDPIQGARIRRLYQIKDRPEAREAVLIQIGRPFYLGDGVVLTVGRNEEENDRIEGLARNGDTFVKIVDMPGPLGLIVGNPTEDQIGRATGIIAHYSKARGMSKIKIGVGSCPDSFGRVREATPIDNEAVEEMKF